MAEKIEVRLVPVEVFGAGCDDPGHKDQCGYGLMDAVECWSDCNRAEGHIFRFDDEFSIGYRLPGETLTILVDKDEYEAFARRFWGDEPGGAFRTLIKHLLDTMEGEE